MPSKKEKKEKKGKKAKVEAKKEEIKIEDKHPGFGCLYIGDKELDRYGFKTGGGLLDVVEWKYVEKEMILEQIKEFGKLCVFYLQKEKFETFEGDKILFVWDPDEEMETDCNFYFCCNEETTALTCSKLGLTGDTGEKEDAIDEEELKKQKEEEEKRLEDERILKAIEKLKQPLIPKPWNDLGSYNEILKSKIVTNRPLIQIQYSRPRRDFGTTPVRFDDQENIEGMNVYIKGSGVSLDKYRKILNKNIQVGSKKITSKTQTLYLPKLNKICQYDYNEAIGMNKKNENNSNNYYSNIDDDDDDNDSHIISLPIQTDNNFNSNVLNDNNIINSLNDNNTNNNNNNNNNISNELNSNNLTNNDNKNNESESDKEEAILQFLDNVVDDIADVLTDNDTIDIFADEFSCFVTNDESITNKTENIKEIQTFVDLNWSRNKKISKIQWMPKNNNAKNKNIVAVSCIENMNFDERVEIMNESRVSTILLWNLNHVLLKAQMILKAPVDIFTFEFHPIKSNIIVGGLETGQVILWDLKSDEQIFNNSSIENKESNNNINDDEEEDSVPQLEAKMLSYIEKSHTKSVTDILWLNNDIIITPKGALKHINLKKRINKTKFIEEEQFMSISGDGRIYFWHINEPEQTEKEKKKHEAAKWIPIYCFKLDYNSLNGLNEINTNKESIDSEIDNNDENDNSDNENNNGIDLGNDDEIIFDENGQYPITSKQGNDNIIFGCKMTSTPLLGQIVIGTELGEFGVVQYSKLENQDFEERKSNLRTQYINNSNFNSNNELNSNKENINTNNNSDYSQEKLEKILLQSNYKKLFKHHAMYIHTVTMSPHFADVCLTVGDWVFCIWKLGYKYPLLFQSPYAPTYLTCGTWSPTRPSVIFAAKIDGTIDIWDLLDQTHAPVYANCPITSVSITNIIFSPSSSLNYNNQTMGVADSDGNLRILEIPRNFAVPLDNEKQLTLNFYKREKTKLNFAKDRNRKHKILKQKQIEEQKKLEDEKNENENNNTNEQNNNKNNNLLNKDSQNTQQNEQELEYQNMYQKMLVNFKKKLGLKEKN